MNAAPGQLDVPQTRIHQQSSSVVFGFVLNAARA